MSEATTRSRAVDYLGFIKRTLQKLTGYSTLAFELIQNSDDVAGATLLRFDVCRDALIVEDDGGFSDCGCQDLDPDACPFLSKRQHRCDFHSFRLLSGGDKEGRETTGTFGIGFTAVYQVTDRPEILSGVRHWIVDETADESLRITEHELQPALAGTRIRLPWARDPSSDLRRRLAAPTVPPDVEDQVVKVLESIAPAMLFLRNLSRIEIAFEGTVVSEVTRRPVGDEIHIEDSGHLEQWRVLRGDFTEDEADLRRVHGRAIEEVRKAGVAVALPIGHDVEGIFCATLPTVERTTMPLHVNAEFFVGDDRRGLARTTAHARDWNTAAIACAAGLVAAALSELPSILGPRRLWALLAGARDLRATDESNDADSPMSAFWQKLEPEIPKHPLVWTTDERWVGTGVARILSSPEEEPAVPVLEGMGVPVAAHDLRPFFNTMRNVGVRLVAVEDVVAALASLNLGDQPALATLPAPIDSSEARQTLWAEVAFLVGGLKEGQRDSARSALERVPIVPATTGELWPLDGVWMSKDAATVELFCALAPGMPFLAHDQLPQGAGELLALCDEFTSVSAIEELEDCEPSFAKASPEELIRWFALREDGLSEGHRERLAALRIFPSGDGGLHRLTELSLPGGFEDPLGLAKLVEPRIAGEHGAFLGRCGSDRLTFARYACEAVPDALSGGNVDVGVRREVVALLARELGQIRDVADAHERLSALPLVECHDGVWRRPEETYLPSETVRTLLGEEAALALIPKESAASVEELFRWLGVADEPRPRDLILRLGRFESELVSPVARTLVEDVVGWLAARWQRLDASDRDEYARLREAHWLPSRDSPGWARPGHLHATYQDYLYASQARFIALPAPLQRDAAELFEWLGVKTVPSSTQVVEHLLHGARTDERPHPEVYRYLSDHVGDPALAALEGAAMLSVDGRWLRPDQVFWGEHSFGSWRVRLGPGLNRYRALFDSLGVRDTPEYQDAIAVMQELSEGYADTNSVVPEADQQILMECWRLCDAALAHDATVGDELTALSGTATILDTRGILVRPPHLFFEDLPGLAEQLGSIGPHIIRRPERAWRAMRAAGVADLSRAAAARIVDVGDRIDNQGLVQRLQERHRHIARVAEAHSPPSRLLLNRLEGLRWIAVRRLTVEWILEAFGRTFRGEPHDADALWLDEEESVYVTIADDGPVYGAVAREFVRAALPDAETATLALGIAAALSPSTAEEADRALDAVGYPRLAVEKEAEIQPSVVVEDMDAAETDGVDTAHPSGSGRSEDAIDAERVTDADGQAAQQPDPSKAGPDGVAANLWRDDGDDSAESEDVYSDDRVEPHGRGAPAERDGRDGSAKSSARSRLRTYVSREDRSGEGEDPSAASQRAAVDRAGVEAVVDYERGRGRQPEVKPHNHPGYDVVSTFEDGEIARFIEVKSTEGPWDVLGVAVTDQQFRTAQQLEDQWWLYVVEYALDEERRRIWRVSDAGRRVTDFLFDEGWKDAAERDTSPGEAPRRRAMPAEDFGVTPP